MDNLKLQYDPINDTYTYGNFVCVPIDSKYSKVYYFCYLIKIVNSNKIIETINMMFGLKQN